MSKPAKHDPQTSGPFETERDAHTAAVTAGGPPRPGWSILSEEQRRDLLTQVCHDAGVSLGTYDERIITWLCGWEDATIAVIAGLITRAAEQTSARKVLDGAIAAYGESLGVSQQDSVTLLAKDIDRARQLAEAMTADPNVTRGDDHPWTVPDVLAVVLERGLHSLEKTYLYGGRS